MLLIPTLRSENTLIKEYQTHMYTSYNQKKEKILSQSYIFIFTYIYKKEKRINELI
jgi:hypothetical protein